MSETEQGSLPTGTRLGAYVLDRCVGAGAMGEVYLGHHSGLEKRVAIKVLQRHVANHAPIRARFLREGKTASLLQHPHVVQVTDVGEEAGTPYLVMEYLEGETLSSMLRRERWQPIERFVDLMLPIVDAVSVAHSKGVIHRDLKPENVFLTQTRGGECHPKVLDFGISKILNDAADPMLTGTQAVLGTPHYMAPEQALQGRDVDARADQYSLGVILYEAVTGKTPHHDTDSLARLVVAISTGRFEPPSTVRPDLPPAFEAIIMRAMALHPNERFPSVALLGAALLPFASARGRALWDPVFLGAHRPPNSTGNAPSPPASRGSSSLGPTPISSGATLGRSGSEGIGARRWQTPALLGALAFVAVIGAVAFLRRSTPPAAGSASTYRVDLTVEPGNALVQIDGRARGQGHVADELPRDGTLHTLLASAEGYTSREVSFRDEPPPVRIVLTPSVPQEKGGKLPETSAAKGETPHAVPGKRTLRGPAVAPKAAEPAPSATVPAESAGSDDWGRRKRTDNKNPWE